MLQITFALIIFGSDSVKQYILITEKRQSDDIFTCSDKYLIIIYSL